MPIAALEYMRELVDSHAAENMGPTALALCCVVVTVHDATRKSPDEPVTFHVGDLLRKLGLKKWEPLDAARTAAMKNYFLRYEPGATKRAPGRYWPIIPAKRSNGTATTPQNGDSRGLIIPSITPGTTPQNGDSRGLIIPSITPQKGDPSFLNPNPPAAALAPATDIFKELPSDCLRQPSVIVQWFYRNAAALRFSQAELRDVIASSISVTKSAARSRVYNPAGMFIDRLKTRLLTGNWSGISNRDYQEADAEIAQGGPRKDLFAKDPFAMLPHTRKAEQQLA